MAARHLYEARCVLEMLKTVNLLQPHLDANQHVIHQQQTPTAGLHVLHLPFLKTQSRANQGVFPSSALPFPILNAQNRSNLPTDL